MMNFIIHFYILLISSIYCFAGPLEDLANMPDLTLFYQQLIRQQDIHMLLQGIYPQQLAGGINDFTIFAPTNEAMTRLTRKNEDLNLLWKYHIVSGRYDEQILSNMAQEKFNQANPRQMSNIRPQNNLPTIAVPFQVFFGLGYYGDVDPQMNETYDNAGYGLGGISWLIQTSINRTNIYENDNLLNPNRMNNYNPNPNYLGSQGNFQSNNPNLFPPNQTNYYNNVFNPNVNPQVRQNPNVINTNYNPYLQQQMGPAGNIGILRPTINNAFILQSRPMSRGVINVIDSILWPPERRDQAQYKTAYDALEEGQFSRLRQLAERSDYFRSELRSIHHQTWFLPNDQAFASLGSSLSFLLDQSYMNNTNDINEFVRAHVVPLVLFPCTMDSTKQVTTLTPHKWITFRKISLPDQSFQIDVISGRHVARILISRSEDIRFYGNGVVYPISIFLNTQTRSAADELQRSYPYFMTLIQQAGDLELISILQGASTQNIYNPQNLFNITVLIPQQMSIQQLGNPLELSMNLRRHILRYPVYRDQLTPLQTMPNVFLQPNFYRTGQQQQQQPLSPQQNTYQTGQKQQQPSNPQQNTFQTGQQQQPLNPQQNTFQTGQQQQPLNPQQNTFQMGQQQQQQPLNPQQNTFQMGQQQQQPLNPQQNTFQMGQQQQQPLNPQQNTFQMGQQQQQQQPINPQQNTFQMGQQQQQQQPLNPQQNIYQTGQQQQRPSIPQQNIYQAGQQSFAPQQQQLFMQPGFNQQQQQQFQMPQFQRVGSASDKKQPRRRRQVNLPPNTNFQPQQFPQQQFPQQQMLNQQQQIPNQPMLLPQQQPPIVPNQQPPILPNQQPPILPNQQPPILPNQQPPFNANYNQMTSFPSPIVFQNGQIYPTLDPQFTVEAQVSTGPNGNIVTLIGRSTNSLPFSATILSSESNIQVKNGVMHVIRGIISGTVVPLEGVLSSVQGASTFSQLLQQTGIINQLRQSGRPYTLFIPTNAALQSISMTTDMNRLTQFVLRHICADVLLDPTSNVLRRSAGFYNQNPRQKQQQQRLRKKRQNWMNNQVNLTNVGNRQGLPTPDLGAGYFQPQQQVYGGYPAAPSPFGSNNQMYNPGYVMNNNVPPNPGYVPGYNGTGLPNPNFNYNNNNMGIPNQPIPDSPWNSTTNFPFNPQVNNMYPTGNGYQGGSVYTRGPQSCIAMTGERITVQSLAGTQPEGNTPSMSYQNFMVTCCGDQSVNSLVQSFNIYPPNFAVYLIGRSLLSQGQTINNMYNHSLKLVSSHLLIFFFIIFIIFKQIQHL